MYPIGFHGGPGGNHNGLGSYYKRLDAAGRPFVIKSVDHYGHLFEAHGDESKGVPGYHNADHILVFRLSTKGQPGEFDFDVPDYSLDPAAAARKHVAATIDRLPPEFNKAKVWLEVINEVDKNRSEWLGHFAAECGQIALRNGYKLLMYGWSSGEPEPEHWELPGQVRYLKMCAQYPDRLGIALHEYSYTVKTLFDGRGFKVGRFRFLFHACDKLGIKRPTTIITEFGWEHRRLPQSKDRMMNELEEAAKLYEKYPEIKGAAIWYLGAGYGDIHNQTQKLIVPVTVQATLWPLSGGSETPPVVDNPVDEPEPVAPPVVTGRGAPRVEYKRRYNILHSTLTDVQKRTIAGDLAVKGETVGQSYDDAGIGDLSDKTAVLHHNGASTDTYKRWLDTHYPGTQFESKNYSTPVDDKPSAVLPPRGNGDARFGLHASTTGGTVSDAEVDLFKTAKIEHVKILSSHSPQTIGRLKSVLKSPPWLVRAFLTFASPSGVRHVSPEQFVQDTISDVERSVEYIGRTDTVIELHNEPNLTNEGLSGAWKDGRDFNQWYLQVLRLYRERLPGYRYIFPGLSPGHDIANFRINHQTFLLDCKEAIDASDGLGLHIYWGAPGFGLYGHESSGVTLLDWYLKRWPRKDVWLTEVSHNFGQDWGQKSREYLQFWRACRQRPQVQAMHFYVASDLGDYPNEVWLGNGVAEQVANRM